MMKKKKLDLNLELYNLIYITLSIIILLLSLFNLQGLGNKNKIVVLGAEADNTYWYNLIEKHPTYRDAWIEIGRMDKVKQIDPNYQP